MKFLKAIANGFKALGRWIKGGDFDGMLDKAMGLVQLAETIAPNKTVEEVIAFYQQYGLPVTDALRDGKLTADEVKSLLALGVNTLLKKAFPAIDTTKANMLLNAAYDELRGSAQ